MVRTDALEGVTKGEQMSSENSITLIGNLVSAPELRFTPQGAAVASFRVASTPRNYDKNSGEFKDGDTLFLTCTVWRQAAENLAESALEKGMRVIVQGRLRQRTYQAASGENRTVYEVDAEEVGPSLRSASAKVTRNEGKSRQQHGGGGGHSYDTEESVPF